MLGPDEFFAIWPCDKDPDLVGIGGYKAYGMTPCTAEEIQELAKRQARLVEISIRAAEAGL